jgi:prepilin-type N-terminal cleavage/methylation domain-containing protein
MRINAKGFTFLELMLVMFILSLFCAIVFPKFNNFLASSALSQAGKMADLLVYVNDKALMSKNEFVLTVDLEKKTIGFKDSGRDKSMAFSRLSKVILLTGEVSSGIASIAVSQWGIQQPLKIYFVDNKDCLAVEFNPISAKAVVMKEIYEIK